MVMPALTLTNDPAFGELLVNSYARLVGESFLPMGVEGGDEIARWLYALAPFGLLVHDTALDPVFIYANQTSQQAFEYSWEEFVGMPSRLSAEAPNRSERQTFMDEVLSRGFVDQYRGRRIAKSGRTFWIEDVTVWNVLDDTGTRQGQAALIRRFVDA
jgi:PAS domain S-box-containing protein